jgi:hypothetical protein
MLINRGIQIRPPHFVALVGKNYNIEISWNCTEAYWGHFFSSFKMSTFILAIPTLFLVIPN